ncbi:class I SAM-dependent methyltransferase [Streptomyces exfoliatus]|uniref:class I SAM-dependent methyltransferase n=1 Tax=Streptomyces exfoliatus TaxID=1905 RepID=UPI0004C934E7|nr:class I SAM-dependent methyltransferase [Streptomyces exfoliatus]
MQTDAPVGTDAYLPSLTLEDYLRDTVPAHPVLKSSVDFGRPGADKALRALAATTTEFDSDDTGRGDSYRRAQQDSSVRWKGMRQLLELAAPSGMTPDMAAPRTVLDVLGGDGTIARAVHDNAPDLRDRVHILTSDLSGDMVEQALAQGLAAIRQAADHLFLADGTMDAALLAYGTHHIAPQDRLDAVTEALRVVKDGGHVVLHDFDDTSPMARFFTDIVHPHTTAGHDYRHFSRGPLVELFAEAGTPARVVDLYDPLVVRGTTQEEARRRMCAYVADMYGVGAFFATLGGTDARWKLLEQYFQHETYLATLPEKTDFTPGPVVYRSEDAFIAEIPRAAIVAVAHKPPT